MTHRPNPIFYAKTTTKYSLHIFLCLTCIRPYLYFREIARVNGKPKVVSQIYIGSPEKVAGLVSGQDNDILNLKVEEFGALFLAAQIDKDLELCGIIDDIVPPIEES